jgi:hypothetical protein
MTQALAFALTPTRAPLSRSMSVAPSIRFAIRRSRATTTSAVRPRASGRNQRGERARSVKRPST